MMPYGDWAQWRERREKEIAAGGGAAFRVDGYAFGLEADEWCSRHGLDPNKVLAYATSLELAERIAAER